MVVLPTHPPARSSETGLSLRREVARKAIHLLFCAIPLAYASGMPRRLIVAMLASAVAAALVIELARTWHEGVRKYFDSVFGSLLREHERSRWSGATWLVVAVLGLALLAPRDVAIAGMWAVSVGDAAAALVGRLAPTARSGQGRKSALGSAACFLSTLAGALLIAHLTLGEGLMAAAWATAAERPTGGVDDNIRIAAAVAAGIFLWRIMFS